MRIATYNVEWFDSLFDDDNALIRDQQWSSRYKVTRQEQADALAIVLMEMDADAVLIVEAPDASGSRDTVTALENFARYYGLRTSDAVVGFRNETKQEIAMLYDPAALDARHRPASGHGDLPRFDGIFSIDLDIDATKEEVRFSKPPLELRVHTASGFDFTMIGVHLKSKAPHGARNGDDIRRIAISARRKQLAQAIWLRARIDHYLADGMPLLVLGDLNDGPGLDAFEDLFGRSSVEIVMGGPGSIRLYDPHAVRALSQKLGVTPTTSRFWIRPEKRYLQALLDYIMVSPDLRQEAVRWRIWHPLDDPECWADPGLRDALLTASDHFPVTLDLSI